MIKYLPNYFCHPSSTTFYYRVIYFQYDFCYTMGIYSMCPQSMIRLQVPQRTLANRATLAPYVYAWSGSRHVAAHRDACLPCVRAAPGFRISIVGNRRRTATENNAYWAAGISHGPMCGHTGQAPVLNNMVVSRCGTVVVPKTKPESTAPGSKALHPHSQTEDICHADGRST